MITRLSLFLWGGVPIDVWSVGLNVIAAPLTDTEVRDSQNPCFRSTRSAFVFPTAKDQKEFNCTLWYHAGILITHQHGHINPPFPFRPFTLYCVSSFSVSCVFFSLTYSSFSQLHLPLTTPLPGSELTKEPFRWDQRLFALVLRIPGNASVEPEPVGGVPPDDSPITPMCEVTGGRKTEGS